MVLSRNLRLAWLKLHARPREVSQVPPAPCVLISRSHTVRRLCSPCRQGRTVLPYGLGMPARKRPTPEDAAAARRILLDGMARDGEVSELVGGLAPLHPRDDPFPGEVFLQIAADALDWCEASRADPTTSGSTPCTLPSVISAPPPAEPACRCARYAGTGPARRPAARMNPRPMPADEWAPKRLS